MRYIFAVDTENHAGSFERHLCGYLTGRTDDPVTHGDEQAEIAEKELSPEMWNYFQTHVILCAEQPDDLPISTPVIPYPTPGWYNNGHGRYFKGKPTAEDLKKCYKNKPWPCYQSVAIFFDERPPKHVIELLKERTRKFVEEYWPNYETLGFKIKLTGFRMLEERKAAKELPI